jgi:pimeloyl-[acyl-carrier protein] methyl ester esterase
MLHGWSMHSGVWGALRDQLAAHYTLYLVDLPGHGDSDWRAGDFDLPTLLSELSEKIPEAAMWLGWSLGGLISLAMADQYPQYVKKLVMLAATPRFVQSSDWPSAMETEVFERFAESVDVDPVSTIQRFILLQARGAAQSRETIKSISEQMVNKVPHKEALRAGLICLMQQDGREALSQLVCPTLFILAEKDNLVPISLADAIPTLNPEIEIVQMSSLGHAPFISQPEHCFSIVKSFIDD